MNALAHKFWGDEVTDEDKPRLRKQHEVIKDYMLLVGGWRTLGEIEAATRYPQASISAQLRHLRKPAFGSWIVEKRRRGPGTWEYRIQQPDPSGQLRLF